MTGRSPNRAGVYDWIPPAGSKPTQNGRNQVHMRSSETTLPQVLKAAGYATCMSGKWHCNSRFNHDSQPQPGDAGFDHWFGTQNNAAPSHENPTNYVRNGEKVGPLEGFSCQLAAEEAIGWMREQEQHDEKPFFLYLAFHEPHEPVASPEKLVAKYLPVAKDEDQAQYFANVTNMDKAVGRMIEALEDLGERENTLVVFTSDNGPETLNRYRSANRSHGQPGPLRGMKLWTTEAGFRVAGIVNWPAKIKQPFISDAVVSSLDFLPTFCNLAGGELPDRTLDGTNFLPLLAGEEVRREKPLIWCYYNAINQRRVAMRHGKWKMLARLSDLPKLQNVNTENSKRVKATQLSDFQLFEIAKDIGELHDVSEDNATFSELRKTMQSAYAELIESSHVW
ncbi:MAG: sulfatase-like hydrolase/transferase [Aureliella sp.]